MTKEMIKIELEMTIELYNEIDRKYTEHKNKFNETSEVFESSLAELEEKIRLLDRLSELY